VLAELSKRLRDASNWIESLATMDGTAVWRVSSSIWPRQSGKVLENDYVAVTRPTHQAIANMRSVHQGETVSRLIHELMKQNLLLSEGKTIYLRKSALDQFRAEL
jgi:CRP-like cAMP-binding protein